MKKIQLSSLEDEKSMSNKHQDVCDMCNVRLACLLPFCNLLKAVSILGLLRCTAMPRKLKNSQCNKFNNYINGISLLPG
jgi:hypothetical protein